MIVDVYHSGDRRRLLPPFLLVPAANSNLPPHPEGGKVKWSYWKTEPVRSIALYPAKAIDELLQHGFFVQ